MILTFKINRVLLWDIAFSSKRKLVLEIFRSFVPKRLLATCRFPTLYFDLFTNATQTSQAVNSLRQ